MSKYRIVKFFDGQYGVQQKWLFWWFLETFTDYNEFGGIVFPYTFDTKEEARNYIKSKQNYRFTIVETYD